ERASWAISRSKSSRNPPEFISLTVAVFLAVLLRPLSEALSTFLGRHSLFVSILTLLEVALIQSFLQASFYVSDPSLQVSLLVSQEYYTRFSCIVLSN